MANFLTVIKAALTESEFRCLEKTTQRLNEEAGKGAKAADAYLCNLTPVQRAVLAKVQALAKDNKQITQAEQLAFAHYLDTFAA